MFLMIFKSSQLYQWSRIGLFVFGAVGLTACSSTGSFQSASNTSSLTAITGLPTNEYHPGKFVWMDLLTADVASARTFYGELFGWTFENQGRYSMIANDGRRIGGMLEVQAKPGEVAEPLWLASMSIADVDKAAAYVSAQGGKVLKGPLEMPNRGRGALVSDPQGAQLILLHAAGGDPADAEPQVGDWAWNEIWSNEPLETSHFYLALGGYESIKIQEDYEVLLSNEIWRGGIRYVPEDKYRTRWVPAVAVAEPEALMDKVEALGGVVLLRPDEAPSNGDTALISDNNGALLMILRWSPEKVEGEQ